METLQKADGSVAGAYRYTAYGSTDVKGTTGVDVVTGDRAQDADIVNPYRFNAKRFDGTTGRNRHGVS